MAGKNLGSGSIFLFLISIGPINVGSGRLNLKPYICIMKLNSDYFLRWRGYFATSAILLLLILAESCNSQPVTSETGQSTSGGDTTAKQEDGLKAQTLPEDFNVFFKRFHEDSVFQLEHTIFPLEGLPNTRGDWDTIPPERFFWQKADWKIHHHFTDPSNNFQQWFEMKGDRVVEHWILMRGTNMYIIRRFAKLEDGWFLIYYQGLRPTVR